MVLPGQGWQATYYVVYSWLKTSFTNNKNTASCVYHVYKPTKLSAKLSRNIQERAVSLLLDNLLQQHDLDKRRTVYKSYWHEALNFIASHKKHLYS